MLRNTNKSLFIAAFVGTIFYMSFFCIGGIRSIREFMQNNVNILLISSF